MLQSFFKHICSVLLLVLSVIAFGNSANASECAKKTVRGASGTACKLTSLPGDVVTVRAKYIEGGKAKAGDSATLSTASDSKRFQLLPDQEALFIFPARGTSEEIRYLINQYDDTDRIEIEVTTARTNLRIEKLALNQLTGDIAVTYAVDSKISFLPTNYVCIDVSYATNGKETRLIDTQCLDECIDKSACKATKIIKAADRPAMTREENEIIAKIDPQFHHAESNEEDNISIALIASDTVESLSTVMTQSTWNVAAKLHDKWLSREAKIANIRAPGGLDFPLGAFLGLYTFDWVISTSNPDSMIQESLNTITNPEITGDREFISRMTKRVRKMMRGKKISKAIPLSEPRASGKKLYDQVAKTITSKYGEVPTEVQAALGTVTLSAIPLGQVVRNKDGSYKATLIGMGVVVFDSYDFNTDQPLGLWLNSLANVESIDFEDVRRFRTAKKRGGDFISQSNVKKYLFPEPVTILIPK